MIERMIKSTAAAAARRGGEDYAFGIWPAQPRQLAPIRLELRRWLAPLEMTGEAQEDMILAAIEAATNSVEHAYPEATGDDTVELIFWTEPDAVYIQIIDHGLWQTPPTEPLERGRGIPIMRRLMDSVLLHHGPDGTSVLLRCPLA
jgi:anti-sigma regulatory factor (Ser/Thr protein kinase)